jgi:hypothetical protein
MEFPNFSLRTLETSVSTADRTFHEHSGREYRQTKHPRSTPPQGPFHDGVKTRTAWNIELPTQKHGSIWKEEVVAYLQDNSAICIEGLRDMMKIVNQDIIF